MSCNEASDASRRNQGGVQGTGRQGRRPFVHLPFPSAVSQPCGAYSLFSWHIPCCPALPFLCLLSISPRPSLTTPLPPDPHRDNLFLHFPLLLPCRPFLLPSATPPVHHPSCPIPVTYFSLVAFSYVAPQVLTATSRPSHPPPPSSSFPTSPPLHAFLSPAHLGFWRLFVQFLPAFHRRRLRNPFAQRPPVGYA